MLSFFLPWKSPSFCSETEVCQVKLFLKNEEFRELKGTDSGPLFLISGKLRETGLRGKNLPCIFIFRRCLKFICNYRFINVSGQNIMRKHF